MTERIPLNKLNAQKIYRSVVKGNMTLQQLAEQYDCSLEQFFAECKSIIGRIEWSRVEKTDKKNRRKNNRKDDISMVKGKNNQNDTENKKRAIQDEMASVREKMGIAEVVLEDFSARLPKAQREEAAAQKLYQEKNNNRRWVEEQKDRAEKQVRNYRNRMEQLQRKLAAFDLYLVAPGYKGEIPKSRLIAVAPIEGYEVTIEKGEELLNEVTFTEVMELGFETLAEANMALEFAKLVLMYQLEYEEEYNILVDDERIIAILHRQEVDI